MDKFLKGMLTINGIADMGLTIIPVLGAKQCLTLFKPILGDKLLESQTSKVLVHMFQWNFFFHGLVRFYVGIGFQDDDSKSVLGIASYVIESLQFLILIQSNLVDKKAALGPGLVPLIGAFLLAFRIAKKNKER